MSKICIAVDVMGGDFGPETTVPASCRFAADHPEIEIALYGDEAVIKKYVFSEIENIKIFHCERNIKMHDGLLSALKRYHLSSIGRAIQSLQARKSQAVISAANTGVLMAISRKILRTLNGIHRPAIISSFPTKKRRDTWIVDLGANIQCNVSNMVQFAIMGIYVAKTQGITNPRVALLNIGHEKHKGNTLIKECNEIFQLMNLNYIGYVEPSQIYSDMADVIVCDGLSGNILLKSCEGTSKFLKFVYNETFKSSWFGYLLGYFFKTKIRSSMKFYDPKFRNGALLFGLDGLVVKSHGSACVDAFYNAILLAYRTIEVNPVCYFEEFIDTEFKGFNEVLQD